MAGVTLKKRSSRLNPAFIESAASRQTRIKKRKKTLYKWQQKHFKKFIPK